MKVILLALFVGVLVAQEPAPYPAWKFCSPRGDIEHGRQTTNHPCHCKRMDADPTCEGEPNHDPVCKQFCHEAACGCPVMCGATS